ncbi:hypothetical protein [Rhizobium sullae]|nr:hypothetical protein [Rhizobium sullae]
MTSTGGPLEAPKDLPDLHERGFDRVADAVGVVGGGLWIRL